ncbi:MAG: hypothetical protein R3B40_14410 [Polyangiales bacterium]|nr:hypothetical protein [Myxococcales bacterium]MCB9659246.1 hypothetical protein [Sandaracinaceae bacterium]
MTEDELIARFGVPPADPRHSPEIRRVLEEETQRLRDGTGDSAAARLLCVHLCLGGDVTDALAVWRAKQSSFDAGCSIDVQLMCGAGLATTKQHLAALTGALARDALDYIEVCEAHGDFDGFDVDELRADAQRYYSDAP